MAEKRKGRDADEKAEDGPAGQSGVGDFAVGGSDYFDDQPAAGAVAGVQPDRPAGAGTTVDDGGADQYHLGRKSGRRLCPGQPGKRICCGRL